MPSGEVVKAIKPSIPTSWDFECRRFVAHETESAVVCAGLLACMAIVRALAHPAHHPELTRMQQGHGWVYAQDRSGTSIGYPYFHATQETHDAVKRRGADLRAWVYDLGEQAEPFTRLPSQVHECRSPVPVEPQGAYEITGLDWPSDVAIVKPHSHYDSFFELREDVVARIEHGALTSRYPDLLTGSLSY